MNKNSALSGRTKLIKSLRGRPWVFASMVVSLVVMIFMLFFFNYADTSTFLIWSVEWWDCVFGKTDLSFVDYTALNLHGGFFPIGCNYSVLQVLPISIWDIPVWVIYRIKDKAIINDLFGIVWFKSGFVICVVLLAREVASLVKMINKEADYILAYPLVFASVDILVSTMLAGQDEVLYLLTLLISMRMLLLGRKKCFLLFATITVSLYPFMLIPLLVILVYKEKRVLVILSYMLITCIPTVVVSVVEKRIPQIAHGVFIDDSFIRDLFSTGVAFNQSTGSVPVVVFVICILLFYSFTRINDDYQLIWILSALTLAITFLSSGSKLDYFYRSVLYVPFCIVLLLISKQNITTNIFLCVIFALFKTWISMCIYKHAFSSQYLSFENEFTKRMFNYYGYVYSADYYSHRIPVLQNLGLIVAVCIGLIGIFLYINYAHNQNRVISVFQIKRDKMVFISSLATPLLLLLMINAFYKAGISALNETYKCRINYGLANYEEIYNANEYYSYAYKEGIHYFHDRAVFDTDNYLSGGIDDRSTRHLRPGGLSSGPGFPLYEGEYQITINGSNLDCVDFDCTGLINGENQLIDRNNISVSANQISYTIELNQLVSDINFRVFNNSENEVLLDEIDIQELIR